MSDPIADEHARFLTGRREVERREALGKLAHRKIGLDHQDAFQAMLGGQQLVVASHQSAEDGAPTFSVHPANELPAGAHMTGIPHTEGTREYLTCEQGRIELAPAIVDLHQHLFGLAMGGSELCSLPHPGLGIGETPSLATLLGGAIVLCAIVGNALSGLRRWRPPIGAV